MGFAGLTSSESHSTDARVGTTDQSVGFGKNSVKIAKGGSLTVVTNNPDVVNQATAALALASNQFGSNLAGLANQQNSSLVKILAAQKDAQTQTIDQIAALADEKLTDGAAGQNKTVLYIAWAFALVLAVRYWRKH